MGDSLKGKGAVVTGSGRGIGREIAQALAEEGASVVVCDIGAGRDGRGNETGPADDVVASIKQKGGKAVTCFESVANFDGAERIIKTCLDSFGRLDILVNCAGNLRERMIFNMTEDDWDSVIAVHLKGTFNTCHFASIVMRQQRAGRIINFTSVNWLGTVGQCNYSAAKGGITSLTYAIARELGRYGITCNAIDPSAATRMTLDEGVRQGLRKRMEVGLISRERYEAALAQPGPEYVPPMIAYLASDDAGYINGQVFRCEAGKISWYCVPVEVRHIIKDFREYGKFSLSELRDMVPKALMTGYINPAPAQPPEKPS
ncbi:MAG: SDR family oxidoreductase [Chloroflexota bacterium]|nr:SDR family oxidoreductase [Chloroflexota bacterium]